MTRTILLITLGLALGVLGACGGGETDEIAATCSISRSALGPFSPDEPLGATMDENQARAAMADTGFDEWIEIRAKGTWSQAWDVATPILGQGIHVDLSWIDVGGEITDLYIPGDNHAFSEVRVSRSFQGKIEHADTPLFVGVDPTQGEPNFDADCEVTSVIVGDEQNPDLLDVLAAAEFPAESG